MLIEGRSPHGERGLKSVIRWVAQGRQGRSPHGERGLKFLGQRGQARPPRGPPQGERGLKSRHGSPLGG